MSRFRLTCPVCCGGVITPRGRTAEGNLRGVCAACYQRVTITVHPDTRTVGIVNKDAPFYRLVELIDHAQDEVALSTQPARFSTGETQGAMETIDA